MRFRYKLAKFMYGRNGFDKLCIALLWTGVVLSVVNLFFGSVILVLLQDILFIWCIFRAMSRNVYKRRIENDRFLGIWGKIKGFFGFQKQKYRDRKTHIFRICPHCKSNLRLPKRKGTHTVRCPRCNLRFEIKC